MKGRRRLGAALASLVVVLAGTSSPAAAAEGDVEAGREVFEANCALCPGADASGMMACTPVAAGAAERLSREGVAVTIRKERDTMPAVGERLTDAQIAEVIAYITSLPEGSRNFGPGADRMDDEMMGDDGMMQGDGMMGGNMMDGMMGGVMVLWVLFLLALIGLAVAAVVWLVRSMRRPPPGADGSRSDSGARAELDRRYASGELSREDYLQRRDDLES